MNYCEECLYTSFFYVFLPGTICFKFRKCRFPGCEPYGLWERNVESALRVYVYHLAVI